MRVVGCKEEGSHHIIRDSDKGIKPVVLATGQEEGGRKMRREFLVVSAVLAVFLWSQSVGGQ